PIHAEHRLGRGQREDRLRNSAGATAEVEPPKSGLGFEPADELHGDEAAPPARVRFVRPPTRPGTGCCHHASAPPTISVAGKRRQSTDERQRGAPPSATPQPRAPAPTARATPPEAPRAHPRRMTRSREARGRGPGSD